jgi:hypothetical protein
MPRGRPITVDTRQARGNFRLELWSYAKAVWVPLAHYREIDWAVLDRKARDMRVGELRLVNVGSGEVLGEWGDSKRLPKMTGAMK